MCGELWEYGQIALKLTNSKHVLNRGSENVRLYGQVISNLVRKSIIMAVAVNNLFLVNSLSKLSDRVEYRFNSSINRFKYS